VEKVLAAAGARPEVTVLGPDGRRMARIAVSMHAFPGIQDGAILVVLRDPVGEKEEAGADGVIHMVPDPAGGRPVEPALIDISGFSGKSFFDLRGRKELSPDGIGRLKVDLAAGEAVVVSILPYKRVPVSVTAKRTDDRLSVTIAHSYHPQGLLPHVVRLDVVDPKTGKGDVFLSRNLIFDKSGSVTAEIPLSLEDRGRPWEIRATDILTGATASVSH
jgi:hypothetical protein